MLMENPKVLVEFVRDGLGIKHVEMIEWMIQPETLPENEKERAFLFEVNNNYYNTLPELHSIILITIIDSIQQNHWSRCQ